MSEETAHREPVPPCFYRVSIKALIVEDGKLMLQKEPESGYSPAGWELPGGGLDFEEDIHGGLVRELQEECGLKLVDISKQPIYIWTNKFLGRRRLKEFWSLCLGYSGRVTSHDFTPSNECVDIRFFSKEDLEKEYDNLLTQAQGLVPLFNPNDFV